MVSSQCSGGSETCELFTALRVMRMNGADETRIVRAADMADFDRIARIGDRCTDQCLFDRPAVAGAGARPHVPGRRRDDLIVLDLAAFDLDPMAERAARRFGRTPAAPVAFLRLYVPGIVQPELAQAPLGLAIESNEVVHAREMPEHHAGAAQFAEHVEHERIVMLPRFAMRAAGDER